MKLNKSAGSILIAVLAFTLGGCSNDGSDEQAQVTIGQYSTAAKSIALPDTDSRCSNGGVEIFTGIDENGDGFLNENEYDTSVVVCNGVDGTDGVDGYSTLIVTSNLPVGNYNCANGGTQILFGLDMNRNTILDSDESNSPQNICNGLDGIDGVDANTAPIVHTLHASPSLVGTSSEINLGAVVSDPDNSSMNFSWQDSDGNVISTSKSTVVTTPSIAGAYLYSFTATDDQNNSVTGHVNVQVVSSGATTSATTDVVIGDENSSITISLPEDVSVEVVTGDIDGTLLVAGSNQEVAASIFTKPVFNAEQTAQEVLTNTISVLSNSLLSGSGATFSNISSRNLPTDPVMSSGITAQYVVTLPSALKPVEFINDIVTLIGSNVLGGVVTTSLVASSTSQSSTSYRVATTVQYYNSDQVLTRIAVVDENNTAAYESVVTSIVNPGSVTVPGMISEVDTETFTANSPSTALMADFLFVVDNSGSMSSYQTAVQTAAEEFGNALEGSNIDFNIGIVSTDSQTLVGGGIIDNNITEFENNVILGTSGSGTETGIWFAEQALSSITLGDSADGSMTQVAHPRVGASMSVILLSDEPSQYTYNSGGTEFDVNNNLFVDRGYNFYSIANLGDDGQYIDLSDATNSSYVSISDTSVFGNIMSIIAANAGAVTNGYKLADDRYVNAASINVYVDGNLVVNDAINGWIFHEGSRTITFHGTEVPAEAATIEVVYQYNRVADVVSMALSIDANAEFNIGDTVAINAFSTFEDNSSGSLNISDMNISSSDSNVISVSGGIISAISTGVADITVTSDSGVSAVISISIADYPFIALNQVTAGDTIEAGVTRIYALDLNASGTLSAQSISSYDTYGYIYDENMAQLTSNDDSGAGANFLISTQLDAGKYYLGVRAYSSSTVISTYDLNISFQ